LWQKSKQKSQALRGRLSKSSSKNLSTTGVNDKGVWDENSSVLFTYNLLFISFFMLSLSLGEGRCKMEKLTMLQHAPQS